MRRFGSLVLTVVAATAALTAPAASAATSVTNGCFASVPDPGSTAAVQICYTMFRPSTATSSRPVPMVLEGHGWGGSRTTDPAAFGSLLGAGFGVISFDQRGFGESGGKAYLMRPDVEGKDVQQLVDLAAKQSWVRKDGPNDPRIGAIGGSYGGGYQFVGAFSELQQRGKTRFDALAPEITWHSLNESLAPQGVARTQWALLLYIAGLPTDAHTSTVTLGLAESAVFGNFPASLEEFLSRNGPAYHVAQGRKLDIPVLMRQGITDNLFPLDQGLKNFRTALTPKARARSVLIGYNGGHTLPSVFPPGTPGALDALNQPAVESDPCSKRLGGSFSQLTVDFFRKELRGEAVSVPGLGKYHLATAGGRCQTVSSTAANTTVELGKAANLIGAGVPLSIPITSGPLTVAGTPTLDAKVTSLALDGRMFLALSVGSSPLDAKIVQNNMLPLREPGIVVDKPRRGVELPSVAVDVPAGQHLYLTLSPLSDMSFGHGSRVPGAMLLEDVAVHLPLVGQ